MSGKRFGETQRFLYLRQVLEEGGTVRISGGEYGANLLEELASSVVNGGGKLIVTNSSELTTDELRVLVEQGEGHVVLL